MKSPDRIAFLRRTELFDSVPDDLLEAVDARLETVRLARGETLFEAGESGDAVYVIRDGVLSLRSGGVQLTTRGRGACVGEFALIDEEPRSAAAVADTDAVLLRWPRSDFQERVSKDPLIARGVFRMLTAKLREEVDQRVSTAREQERWRQDLARAKEIQSGMLPPEHLRRPGLEVAGRCSSAAEVGGDFYDYVEFGADETGVIIGDVTGHGFYSALLVAMAKSCVHTQAGVAHAPVAIMGSLRRTLALSLGRRMLMSCCYVVFDVGKGMLTYANAGHPYPYLYRAEADRLEKLEALDPILGALDEEARGFGERELPWRAGDFLVLYSDGLSEARDAQGQMFEADAIARILRGGAGASAVELRDRILSAFRKHAGDSPLRDDLTLVVVRGREPDEEALP